MEHTKYGDRHAEILAVLSQLPRKMVALQGDDQAAAFVLYELCQQQCFDIERAAYFVDNPDFNCLKGVVGCSRQELSCPVDIWQAHDSFAHSLKQSDFHNRVSALSHTSIKHEGRSETEAIAVIAQQLGIQNPTHCSWNLKNDNHGLLIFQRPEDQRISEEQLVNGLSLLSFCPIM